MARSSELNIAHKHSVRDRRRQHISETLGDCCFFCRKSDVNLATHRKDGKPHKKFSGQGLAWVKSEVTVERYVRLCYPCHKGVHWAMDFLDMSWDDIVLYSKAVFR